MSDRFTDSIEPLALATQGRLIEGKVALKELKGVGREEFTFKPGRHDVYTHVEQWLRERAGARVDA